MLNTCGLPGDTVTQTLQPTDVLRDNHDRLRTIMREYAAVLAARPDDIRAALLGRRVDFSQIFSGHIAAERAAARIVLSLDAVRAAEHEMLALFRDYSAHIRAWTPALIEAEWPTYVAAVLALQVRLRRRFDWAERELFPRLRHAPAA